ncbi:hypothetical protein SNEBB_009845 [Seison nebaliae]|nr:hypothetical protein SNEBB_009845 [Seison nebaliae]
MSHLNSANARSSSRRSSRRSLRVKPETSPRIVNSQVLRQELLDAEAEFVKPPVKNEEEGDAEEKRLLEAAEDREELIKYITTLANESQLLETLVQIKKEELERENPYMHQTVDYSQFSDAQIPFTDDSMELIKKFVDDAYTGELYMYFDQENKFHCEEHLPKNSKQSFFVIWKQSGMSIKHINEFLAYCEYTHIKGDMLNNLLKQTNKLYSTLIFNDTSWPDSIRNELAVNLHKFNTAVTDAKYLRENLTHLYLPKEGLHFTEEECLLDKEFLQRLESIMIYWSRQLKSILTSQKSLGFDDSIPEKSGPLAEIEFWRSRCHDLNGIKKQLDKLRISEIIRLLDLGKSTYLQQFVSLAREIRESSNQAESNLKFLQILKDPCYELVEVNLRQISNVIPRILQLVRIVWRHSDYYNTDSKLTALFKRISNAIIIRCRQSISVEKIFKGFIYSCRASLKDAISICNEWRIQYKKAAILHNRFSNGKNKWQLDETTIFAQMDAFLQRCHDLQEICDCQIHFARFADGERVPPPQFGGTRSTQTLRSLRIVENSFDRYIDTLGEVADTALDVTSTVWHDRFSNFRLAVQDLEVMIKNTIRAAFDTAANVEQAIEILDVFMHLADRESVRRTLDKETVKVHLMINDMLNSVKRQVTSGKIILSPMMPQHSGAAVWARGVKRRLERTMLILNMAHFLPPTGVGEETRTQYKQVVHALDELIRKRFADWNNSLDSTPHKLLDRPLLKRQKNNRYLIQSNYSAILRILMQEIRYWDLMNFEFPNFISDFNERRNELRSLSNHVELICREYNRIYKTLSADQRGLFKEKVKKLDKKMAPGINRLMFQSKQTADYFMQDSRSHIMKVQRWIDEYKRKTMAIYVIVRDVSRALLVQIDSMRTYEVDNFNDLQAEHRQMTQHHIHELYNKIIATMKSLYEIFRSDTDDVLQQWHIFCEYIDEMIEEALRINLKLSINEIFGNLEGRVIPLFKIYATLGKYNICIEDDQMKLLKIDHESEHINFRYRVSAQPSIDNVREIILSITDHSICEAFAQLDRLPNIVSTERSLKQSFASILLNDSEKIKMTSALSDTFGVLYLDVQKYLGTWDEQKDIYNVDMQLFLEKYRDGELGIRSIEADISRYTEIANNVDAKESIKNISFIDIDNSPLKTSLCQLCSEWQKAFIDLLKELAIEELLRLRKELIEGAEKARRPPETHLDLAPIVAYHHELQQKIPEFEAAFRPINDKFDLLAKYDVDIDPDIIKKYNTLNDVWKAFLSALGDAKGMIVKHKEKFKTKLLNQTEDFNKNLEATVLDFKQKGPYSSNMDPKDALNYIREMKAKLLLMEQEEENIRDTLRLFNIDHPMSKDIELLKIELDLMEEVWMTVDDWQTKYSDWSNTHFTKLDVLFLEDYATAKLTKMKHIHQEVKSKDWEVVDTLIEKLEQFKKSMPMINDLNKKALRTRHWEQIKEETSTSFDETSEDFTLGEIIRLRMDQYAVIIEEVAQAAEKEFAIENKLKDATNIWNSQEIDCVYVKEKPQHRIRNTDVITTMIEDHQVTLSAMKTSKFVKPFYAEVDYLERTISKILEIIELLLSVQRQWLYLENIFGSGEDIRRQLPQESREFDIIDLEWKEVMKTVYANPNAYMATHQKGIDERLALLIKRQESIQKSLEEYLETKRIAFPRFYFISNDDLLQILGLSKLPNKVMVHMKKLFDNLRNMDVKKLHIPGAAAAVVRYEASTMESGDGEIVPLTQPASLNGPVELWLKEVEKLMRSTLQVRLKECRVSLKRLSNSLDLWLKENPGQLCIVTSQIQWTIDCERTLMQVKEKGDKRPFKIMRRKQIQYLAKFSEMIRQQALNRQKLVALVTIEVHARDVIERLIKSPSCQDISSFDWLMQQRYYWDKHKEICIIRQTNTEFHYGYEYIGNSGRLVITPLTDRCYLTLTTALYLHRGGSPKGPAGTGKTETVKDLGKSLGQYVIVINCSDGLDYKSMGRMFSGFAQSGAWGCFDEFNRINVEVLSVVAQQITSILKALARNVDSFVFEGREITLTPTCGIFITMNPGYAGRSELPDNLKSMFRPIAMVVPDSSYIAEITLFGEGFNNTRTLARKAHTLYRLAIQQLSKQDHYDFGLRSLVSVLRHAGNKKRKYPTLNDEEILLLAMNDMNIPKMTPSDLPLFSGIVSDLFPSITPKPIEYKDFGTAITTAFTEHTLQPTEAAVTKVTQLYETLKSRHSVMIVGDTQSGKSTTWKMLQCAVNEMSEKYKTTDSAPSEWNRIFEYPLNPKTLSLGEIYGDFNLSTNEWTDGILSSLMRHICSDTTPAVKWLLFDSPVDTLWIESMNSVMDDNKILTLINGERISMPPQVSLLFELDSLAVASPATVSRCGMVFCHLANVGWKALVNSWLSTKSKALTAILQPSIDKYFQKTLDFIRTNCKTIVQVTDMEGVRSFCTIFDVFADEYARSADPNGTFYSRHIDMWFIFSLIWSIGGALDEVGRKKLDSLLREMEGTFPNKDSVYEYYVDVQHQNWMLWEEKLRSSWKYDPMIPFFKIIVPTVDTVRYKYLVTNLVLAKHPVLLVGPVGTGKTSVAQDVISNLDSMMYGSLIVNMSAQTTSRNLQMILETKFEKRTKGHYVPKVGQNLIAFLDDMNMPAKDEFGSQPPLELLRHWMDYGFWYNRQDQTRMYMQEMFTMGAMGPPGGGRMQISPRFQSRFCVINMTFPTETEIKRIFGSMLKQKLEDFSGDISNYGESLTNATIEMYNEVIKRFLPTPTKIHYLFNMRDISKIFQGLLRITNTEEYATSTSLVRLWVHENFRVFHDRLNDERDVKLFIDILSDKLGTQLDLTYHNLCQNKIPPIFCDFITSDHRYVDIFDYANLKAYLEQQLGEFNLTTKSLKMDLVFFRDAVQHVTRITRVIRQSHGNMLLIGVGGSGRQCLSRLASFICHFTAFQTEVHKGYTHGDFREDIKQLYNNVALSNREQVFLFADTQIVDELFLEDINNMLSSGEVPNLYRQEEIDEIKTVLQDIARRQGIEDSVNAVFQFFLDRVKSNLRIIVCMSPVGEIFRNRIRMYPALVNCTTIDLFTDWPAEALLEVAEKYVGHIDLGENSNCRNELAVVLTKIHTSARESALMMKEDMQRDNYITPFIYLEMCSNYKTILENKKTELGTARDKLKGGLSKIAETSDKVEQMSESLEIDKIKVLQFQKECEEFLFDIVQQKREADDKQKAVQNTKLKIADEEVRCEGIAETAKAELAEAMPAYEEAKEALNQLSKRDIAEVKAFTRPPRLVQLVLEAVMVMKQLEPSWAEAKRQLDKPGFLKDLQNFDKDNISDRTLRKIVHYTSDRDFMPDLVGRVSTAAKSLCMWVRAIEAYGHIYRVVHPKQQRYDQAQADLNEKRLKLQEAENDLAENQKRIDELQQQYKEKMETKDELARKAQYTEMMLDRASKIVSGLAGERERWQETVEELEEKLKILIGDCLLAIGFICYFGPFVTSYRLSMIRIWRNELRRLEIPFDPSFEAIAFLSKPTLIRQWNIQGLPSDDFSIQNGCIVNKSFRFPLLIDPQGQGTKWIKRMEKKNSLVTIDPYQSDFVIRLRNAITNGFPCLMMNVQEKLDPVLNPILLKQIKTSEKGESTINVGSVDITYHPNFFFYMATKLSNPNFAPELSAKVSIVNFAVIEQGMEAQLLGSVVKKEKPDLEQQKHDLVVNIAEKKQSLVDLEDKIVMILTETKGSLLDDENLVNTLEVSKATAKDVTESLITAENTEKKIDAAREAYRPCAIRASILFFTLNSLSFVEPMYQYSLDSYISLFNNSIEKSQKSAKQDERIHHLNDYHTYAVYRFTCRGLFERHKLIFAFRMCLKIMESQSKVNQEEYLFFLRGGTVLDRDTQSDNPCAQWLPEMLWDNITELDKLPNFRGIIQSFEQFPRDWHQWFQIPEPEKATLPGEWDSLLNDLQRLIIVRSLRPDRIAFCVTQFIITNIGMKYVEPPVLDMKQLVDESNCRTPLIFVLSPGVDPTQKLLDLAERCRMADNTHALSLGQGQAPIASRMIQEGISKGSWIYLANCHLSLSWMPELDKLVEQLQHETLHPTFRLWLSSAPDPNFPVSILQNSVKITTEPPKGIKSNMKRLYGLINEQHFERCSKAEKYKKLLYCLCFFHTVLLERKKFLQLGWNVDYPFNDSDFEVSDNLLSLYLDEYDETPWDALKYLIATINYGGHLTDEWDMRLLQSYINSYFVEDVLSVEFFKLSNTRFYIVPRDGTLNTYRDVVNLLPSTDHPEAFGQHPNADISSQIKEADSLFKCLALMQPEGASQSTYGETEELDDDDDISIKRKKVEKHEPKVLENCAKILEQLPTQIDYESAVKIFAEDDSPLTVVLLQEIQRYNILLAVIKNSLVDLQKGIKGLVVMSTQLDDIFNSIYNGDVPESWKVTYPSLKQLGSWTRDLLQRIEQLNKWAETSHEPVVFWLSGFSFPTCFLTAVLQTTARKTEIPIDSLSWEFNIISTDEQHIMRQPSDGVYIKGLFLEGASWDRRGTCLTEPQPMQLICPMPVIHFKPIEQRKKQLKGMYNCPCYYYPKREGASQRPSFIIAIDLKPGEETPDHWIKRGTAILMSLN